MSGSCGNENERSDFIKRDELLHKMTLFHGIIADYMFNGIVTTARAFWTRMRL
jgi:hypothetical protein